MVVGGFKQQFLIEYLAKSQILRGVFAKNTQLLLDKKKKHILTKEVHQSIDKMKKKIAILVTTKKIQDLLLEKKLFYQIATKKLIKT